MHILTLLFLAMLQSDVLATFAIRICCSYIQQYNSPTLQSLEQYVPDTRMKRAVHLSRLLCVIDALSEVTTRWKGMVLPSHPPEQQRYWFILNKFNLLTFCSLEITHNSGLYTIFLYIVANHTQIFSPTSYLSRVVMRLYTSRFTLL